MSNLDTALEYLRRGWAVMPLSPPTAEKHGTPLVGWSRLQESLPTEDDVRQWWGRWPDAGIAIITGKVSGLVVVDVDPRHGGTFYGLPETSCVVGTGGGGRHYYYAYPFGAKSVACQVNGDNSQDEDRRGRDVRADGGYVIAPPSTHWSGKSYVWSAFDARENLSSPPAWSLTPIAKEEESKRDKWLSQLLTEGAKLGQRNDSLTRMAGYFAGKGVPRDVALQLCLIWLKDTIDDYDFTESEVEVTVRSAYRTEARRNPQRRTKGSIKDLFTTLTLSQFMRAYGEQEIHWTVEEWLPASTVGFIASPPGGFKTWLTFDLAASVASGEPFLDRFPVDEPGPVLIVQQEDFNAQTAARNALVIMNRLRLPPPSLEDGILEAPILPGDDKLPLYFHADRMLRFDDPQVMDAFEEAVKRIRPKLAIVDPFYQTVSTDEYMAKAAADLSRIKSMRDKYGTTFLLVHHTTKQGESEWGRSKLWGSQFLNAWSETLWHIRRPGDELFNLIKRTFKLSGPLPPIRIDFDIDDAAYRYSAVPSIVSKEEAERLVKAPHQTKDPSLSKRILQALTLAEDGLSTQELSDELDVTTHQIETSTKKLTQKGDISLDALGKWRSAVPHLG